MNHAKIKLSARDTIAQLRQAIKNSNDEAQKTRIRAIINTKTGMSRTKVTNDFVISHPTLRYWIREYNRSGVKALKMSKGGRPEGNPVWDSSIFDKLAVEISKGGKYWSIPLMQEWISKNHKKEIPESTVWYHLKIRDMSYKSARPSPYKGDKETQEVFKKRG